MRQAGQLGTLLWRHTWYRMLFPLGRRQLGPRARGRFERTSGGQVHRTASLGVGWRWRKFENSAQCPGMARWWYCPRTEMQEEEG